jgi:hypothetical protein
MANLEKLSFQNFKYKFFFLNNLLNIVLKKNV